MKLIIGTASSLALFAWQAMAQNLVVNGNFENPTTGYYASFTAGSTNIPGWTVDSTPGDGVEIGAPGVLGNNGSQNLELTGGNCNCVGGGIHQTITTTPGQTYLVSIDVCARSAGTVNCNFVFGATTNAITTVNVAFQTFSWEVVASGSSTLIDIIGNPNSVVDQTIIDNVSVVAVANAPNIMMQPTNTTSFVSADASFSVIATGALPLSYQWYLNTNTLVVGASAATLHLVNIQTSDAGNYLVIVTNSYGSVTSSVANLNLLSGANLISNGGFENPANVGYTGYPAGDTVDLPGWIIDSTPPDGVLLAQAGTFGTDNGSQNLALSGYSGFTTGGGVSQSITTTPGTAYTISIDCASAIGLSGNAAYATGNFSFGGINHSLTSSGTTFQREIWTVYAPSGGSTLVDITGDPNSANRQLVIDNVYVGIASGGGTIPVFTLQPPNSVTNFAGTTTSFTVAASGTEPLTYLWYFNTNQLVGTNATLTLTDLQLSQSGSYFAVATNLGGSATSSVVNLTVSPGAPQITSALNQVISDVYAGGYMTISASALGALPLSYQWVYNNVPIPGATSASLAFSPIEPDFIGAYSLIVTNAYGSVTGLVATVSNVLPNLTQNWGFESPQLSGIDYLGPNNSTITGWTTDGAPYDGAQFAITGYFGLSEDGSQTVQLTGSYVPTGGAIHQTINTTPGQRYHVSIDVGPRSSGSVICYFVFGATTNTITTTVNGFQTFSWDVTATGSSTLIDIIGNPHSDADQTIIDNVLVQPAPSIAIQQHGANIILSWPYGTLQQASFVNGPYSDVPGASSPWTNSPPFASQQFYRLAW